MFNGPSIAVSCQTTQTLTFRRADVSDDNDPTRGQLTPTFKDVLTVLCDVQPRSGSRILNTRLASMYAQMFDIIIPGTPDVQRNDRVMINGDQCVVESVNPYGSHTEVDVGAIE